MALPINIEDLLHKQKIEGNRIEFKSGWNPDSIYHSICGFANDFDNIGGGYIVVGVEEEKGIVKRPVKGIPAEKIDGLLKDMVGYNNKINPYYMPRTSVEEVDGQYILVIWVPAGVSILSYAGPDRSISMEAIKQARTLKARRYRNRRLGDFLKELNQSEGRATRIPTIQDELRKNGSGAARIETDEERSYFLLEIPRRDGFENSSILDNTKGELKSELKIMEYVFTLIKKDPKVTIPSMIVKSGKSRTTIQKCIKKLKEEKRIERVGGRNGGVWKILK